MAIFYVYEGSTSSSEDLATTNSSPSIASTCTVDEITAFLLNCEIQPGCAAQDSRDNVIHLLPNDTSNTGSFVSEIISEDSLDFVGPHTKSYAEELERLSKRASAFFLPSQSQAVRLMTVEGIPSVVATYAHPIRPDDFFLPVPKTSSRKFGQVRKMVRKIFRRGQ